MPDYGRGTMDKVPVSFVGGNSTHSVDKGRGHTCLFEPSFETLENSLRSFQVIGICLYNIASAIDIPNNPQGTHCLENDI